MFFIRLLSLIFDRSANQNPGNLCVSLVLEIAELDSYSNCDTPNQSTSKQ